MNEPVRLTLSHDAQGFFGQVRDFLERHEGEHALLLGMLARHAQLPRNERPFMALVEQGGAIAGVALLTNLNLILSRGAHLASELLVSAMIEGGHDVPGIVGPHDEVKILSRAWQAARGCEVGAVVDQMLYELRAIDWPTGIPGRMRPMDNEDVDLVTAWLLGFHRDALPHEPFSEEEARANAEARPAQGMTYLWEVDGEPVAMAALARPTRRGITINAVYTPPLHRRHGCASALVAALSAEGLGRGKEFCALYTDLSNPTSNAIYQRIGYRPVARSQNVRFRYPS